MTAALKEFARGGMIGLAGSIVAAVAGFALTVTVARVLGPAGAGVFFVVVALIAILTEVTELGADTGLVRLTARFRALNRVADLRRVFAVAFIPVGVISFLVAALLYGFAPWVAGVFAGGQADAVLLLHIAAPFLAVAAARNLALAGTRGLGSVTAYTLIGNVAMPALRPLLVLAVFALGYGAGAVMLAWSIPGVLAFLAAAFVLRRLLLRREHADPTAPPRTGPTPEDSGTASGGEPATGRTPSTGWGKTPQLGLASNHTRPATGHTDPGVVPCEPRNSSTPGDSGTASGGEPPTGRTASTGWGKAPAGRTTPAVNPPSHASPSATEPERSGTATGGRTSWGATAREFWGFAGPRGVASVLEIAIVQVGVLLAGAMLTSHDAGIYATASRFVTTGTLVLAATRIAIAPQISAMLARGERAEAQRLNAVATGWVVAASWPLYLSLAVFGPFVLTLFGEDFTGGAVPLAILALGMLGVLAAGNVQTVLLMGGKSSWSLLNKVVALTVCVAAHLILLPAYGLIGAAVAWAITMLVDTALAAVQVRMLLGLRLGLRGPAVAALWALLWFGGAGLVVRSVLGANAGSFALYLLVACAGYGFALWRLRARLHLDVLLRSHR
ncbi:polysaccharide biosynthesis C-terminal domain-containing protein [Rhizohabitans arisaemae]|uniref:polysaccharide biosynthesis C-terminal domain-containing protein n=1 Tax=Rhizohabitans arisaemae TaxID=2720610 RepID=UPI0024B25AD2|nr:polysaccharide biosynthesis C-terminal domain-containing protein [Rhizohabitans arisaemae]